jgi:SAM-dependent methyltransferase
MERKVPIVCGVCENSSPLSKKEQHNEFTLFECKECNGQFWFPMENPGSEWYGKDERYSFRNLNPLKKPERNHRQFLQDLPAPNSKLLDLGMGTGNFLAAARMKGYDVYGIDFDSGAIHAAKEAFGLDQAAVGDIDDALHKFGKNTFNIVTMFEVLEHVENPGDFLEKVKQLLAPGGYIVVSVPYRGFADWLKPFDKPPRHLSRWNKRAMENLFKAHECNIVRMKIIHAPVSFLITKFHFWFRGITSFNMVSRVTTKDEKKGIGNPKKQAKKIKNLQHLARAKDYILFTIPATLLWMGLMATRKNGLGLYVLARKRN